MYVVKRGQHSAELDDAFGRLFTTFDDLIRQGQQAGELQPGDTDWVRLLLFTAIQGIAHSSPPAASTPGRPTNSSRTRSHYSPTARAKPVGAKNCLLIHPRGLQPHLSRLARPAAVRPPPSGYPHDPGIDPPPAAITQAADHVRQIADRKDRRRKEG
jgi:hypothetical protein